VQLDNQLPFEEFPVVAASDSKDTGQLVVLESNHQLIVALRSLIFNGGSHLNCFFAILTFQPLTFKILTLSRFPYLQSLLT